MADKTSSDPQAVAGAERISVEIADGVQTYAGGLAAIRGPGHATTQGYADVLGDTPGLIPLGGFFSDQTLGATSDTPPPENNVDLRNKIWKRKAVTGVASRADIGKLVYATDDQTVTLTKPADDAMAIGVVVEWHTSTTCDVFLFGFAVLSALALSGGGFSVIPLGQVQFTAAGLIDGDLKTGIAMRGHGKIISMYCVTNTALVGSGGTGLLNVEIGGTNTTGGVLTLSQSAGATLGTTLTSTAFTALNEYHDGDTIDIEGASTGGTITSGSVDLFLVVEHMIGL
jgi:hypothetical protein